MTENQRIAELLKEKKWKELLQTLPLDRPTALHFETVNDMNTIRSAASRMNSTARAEQLNNLATEKGRIYSIVHNYELMTASITVTCL